MALASISLILIISQLLLQIIKIDAKVSSIIVFGDSSVDSGNNNFIPTVAKSNFRPYDRDFDGGKATGRFSNGRVPTDFISEAFGLKKNIPAYLDPSYTIQDFATGVCFASAGTGYDNITSKVLSVIPLWKELEYYKEYQSRLEEYLGNQKASEILSEALYIISIGTNDFLENYYVLPHRQSQFSIEEYQNFLAGIARNFITQIYKLKARKISLTGLPPMGCLPLERTTNLAFGGNCIDRYNRVAINFNQKLQALVESLNKELSGLQLVLSSPYTILYDIIQNPYTYGFEYSATACCGTGRFEMGYLCDRHNPFTCSDADRYVFWDSFHPTEKTNGILANYAVKTTLAVFH
ncbi:hypothetical protein ABFS83_13G163500 [Erythranthe nasuta]